MDRALPLRETVARPKIGLPLQQLGQLGDIRRYPPCLIKSQRVGNSSIARISVALHISKRLPA